MKLNVSFTIDLGRIWHAFSDRSLALAGADAVPDRPEVSAPVDEHGRRAAMSEQE